MDIFDTVLEKKKEADIFKRVLRKKLEGDIFERIRKEITPTVRAYVKSNKQPPAMTVSEVTAIIRAEVEKIPLPEKVIEKTIIREIKKEDKKEYADLSLIDELRSEIKELKKELAKTRKMAEEPIFVPGGPGVIGIPAPEGNEGKVLKVFENRAQWRDGNGGAGIDAFYFGDPNTDGTWRLYNDGTNLLHERRESGSWVEKSADLA